MKTCTACQTILPDDPYRSVPILTKTYNKSRGMIGIALHHVKRIPFISIIGSTLLNAILGMLAIGVGLTVIAAVGWLVFPGIYYLGQYILIDKFHVNNVWGTPEAKTLALWGTGMATMAALFAFWFVGMEIRGK